MGARNTRRSKKEPEEDHERTELVGGDKERAPYDFHLLHSFLPHSRRLPDPWHNLWGPKCDDLELSITRTQGWKDNGNTGDRDRRILVILH
jgi:hypothetical protein